MDRVSLARALSKLGFCSRAEAHDLVRAGRVRVDDQLVTDPSHRVDVRHAHITVEGRTVRPAERAYLALHKPAGYVTTASDERGRRTVYDLLPAGTPRVNAVGRLDLESEGLLLFTNDTRWADRVTDPRRHIDRTYHVQLDRAPDEALLDAARRGVGAQRGEVLRLKRVTPLEAGPAWLEVVLDEGRNRQIRRVFEALGSNVVRLIRVAIGPVTLDDLRPGSVRPLTSTEKELLDRATRVQDRP